MLWYKGWLETRFRLLFSFGFAAFLLVSLHSLPPPAGGRTIGGVALMASSFLVVVYSMLAGAGLNTQPAFQAAKGLHGSTLFTLSLPVSRRRLLIVRSSLGWLEMSGVVVVMCGGLWFSMPQQLKVAVTAGQMAQYAETLIACASGLYFFSVCLSTFLDDIWRMWGTMGTSMLLLFLSNTSLPPAFNIGRAMEEASPLVAHTVPWTAMIFSISLAVAAFVAALRIAKIREY